MVADGLSFINADFSSTSFRVSRASIGAAQLPRQQHRLSLAGQGPVTTACSRPRSWSRSTARSGRTSDCSARPASRSRGRSSGTAGSTTWRARSELRRRLAAKNRHNLVTMALYLLVRWVFVFVVTLVGLAAADLYDVVRCRGDRAGQRRHRPVHRRLLRAGRTCRHGRSGVCSRWVARSTTRTSGGTSGSGRCLRWRTSQVFNGTPVQEPDLADAGRPDRPPGLRRRLRGAGEDARHHRGRLHAQRGQHHPVPLAGGRRLQVRPDHASAPAARSASAPSSTTA